MPTYEYECRRCGHRFEEFQQMTDAPLEQCPECGGQVERLIGTGSAILFKGSGFYATEYARKGTRSAGCCGEANPCDHPKRCCESET